MVTDYHRGGGVVVVVGMVGWVVAVMVVGAVVAAESSGSL